MDNTKGSIPRRNNAPAIEIQLTDEIPRTDLSALHRAGGPSCNVSLKIRRLNPSQIRKASAMTALATTMAGNIALKTATTAFHISLWKKPMRGERKLLNS